MGNDGQQNTPAPTIRQRRHTPDAPGIAGAQHRVEGVRHRRQPVVERPALRLPSDVRRLSYGGAVTTGRSIRPPSRHVSRAISAATAAMLAVGLAAGCAHRTGPATGAAPAPSSTPDVTRIAAGAASSTPTRSLTGTR